LFVIHRLVLAVVNLFSMSEASLVQKAGKTIQHLQKGWFGSLKSWAM